MTAALLDTSFLITLVNTNRPNHEVAKMYYRHMLQFQIPMYFSAIVAAEFGIKQAITDLPLGNFRGLPFNMPHGQEAARMWNLLSQRDSTDLRHVVRDDVKLMAQACHEDISLILTEDGSTLYKYCERLRTAGYISTRPIRMIDGFDPGVFAGDGQHGLALSQSPD